MMSGCGSVKEIDNGGLGKMICATVAAFALK
jgi:hypothetical protein